MTEASSHFQLSLSDDTPWQIREIGYSTPFLDKFAPMMQLKKGKSHNGSLIIFIRCHGAIRSAAHMNELLYQHSGIITNTNSWDIFHLFELSVWQQNDTLLVVWEKDDLSAPYADFVNFWIGLFPVYRKIIFNGGMPIHAGLIARDTCGVMLIGSSGAGKSTCCRRLPEGWDALCDDEILVVKSRDSVYRAHPFPTWSEYLWRNQQKSWYVEASVPIRAMFFIEPAGIDRATPIGSGTAASLISLSANQIFQRFLLRMNPAEQRAFRTKLFENACEMAKRVPAYRLMVTKSGKFWEIIEEIIT